MTRASRKEWAHCRTCGRELTPDQRAQGYCAKCELVQELLIERYSPSPRKKGHDDGPSERS